MSVLHVYQTPQALYLTQGVGSPNQNYPVNRSDFRLVQGVRNEVEVFVKDLDRKPVAVTGTPVLRVLDRARQNLLLEAVLVAVDAAKGRYRLVVDAGDRLPLGSHVYAVLLEMPGEAPTVLCTDRDRGVSGVVEVVAGPHAVPAPATVVPRAEILSRDGRLVTTALPGAAQVDHREGLHAALCHLTGFTGTVTVQGSLEAQPTSDDAAWFEVARANFADADGARPLTFEGMLVWVRFVIEETAGTVEKIVYRN